ncbi:DsbA family protein [Streptomyces sp. NPDC051684]|uniref:DsbA family protein n=1 Tax=Streptomyces sp. NPDC051684 TaxID=3365670 RepID=UPI0037AD24F9
MPSTPSHRLRLYVAGGVFVAAAATATFALTMNGDADSTRKAARDKPSAAASVSTPSPAPADDGLLALARRDASDALAVGRADAPVVLIEYADFQCPFCGQFARETGPELLRRYVDKGVLRIEWHNFPVFGKESEQAALAGWAAGRQKKFWPFYDTAFGKPRERNAGEFSTEKLVAMAREAGVPDLDRFRSDMAGAAARKAVSHDQDEGYQLGVTSTPAFLVNGRPVLGAQPLKTFVSTIEAAEKEAGADD